jgi:ADP-heptose:LPS heptosyltransferase
MTINLHHIERFFKKIANKFVQNNYTPEKINTPERIFTANTHFKILLLRHDRLGDVLISIPFVRELRDILPGAKIDILLSFKNKTAARIIEKYTNNILILDNKPSAFINLIRRIRRERYDLIIDLLDNESATSNLIMKYSIAVKKLGFDKSNANNYNYVVPIPHRGNVHIVKRLFSLLIPFGEAELPDSIKLEFPLNKEEINQAKSLLSEKQKRLRLGINLTGSNESKYWGDENYINFIREITTVTDVEVLLFAVLRIKDKAEKIAAATGASMAPIQNDFFIYAAMLNECDLILTPDTVAVHLAAAFGKPVITLFHSPEPQKLMPWYPLDTASRSIVAKHSIAEITVEQVLAAYKELKGKL